MNKLLFLIILSYLLFCFNSCTVVLKEKPVLSNNETKWAVIKSWDGEKNVDKVFLWSHPKKRGPKPYKVISPGTNVRIIKFESAAACIMLPDGITAWIDDIFVK